MKIIDLLNKIAKGEEVPEKIKYDAYLLRWTGSQYYCDEFDFFLKRLICTDALNDEVEIIEEEKDIEELSPYMKENDLVFDVAMNRKAINEVIRAINKLKNKE